MSKQQGEKMVWISASLYFVSRHGAVRLISCCTTDAGVDPVGFLVVEIRR